MTGVQTCALPISNTGLGLGECSKCGASWADGPNVWSVVWEGKAMRPSPILINPRKACCITQLCCATFVLYATDFLLMYNTLTVFPRFNSPLKTKELSISLSKFYLWHMICSYTLLRKQYSSKKIAWRHMKIGRKIRQRT